MEKMNFLLSSFVVLVLSLENVVSFEQTKALEKVYGTGIDFENVCKGPKPWHFVCEHRPMPQLMPEPSYKDSITYFNDILTQYVRTCNLFPPNGEHFCRFFKRSADVSVKKPSYKVSKQAIKDMAKKFKKTCSTTPNGERICHHNRIAD